MNRIFINAKTEMICGSIAAALEDTGAEITSCFDDESASAADLSGYDMVAEIRGRTDAVIIVIAKTEIADEVQSRIKFTGAYVLPRPFTKQALLQTVRMAEMTRENLQRLEQEKSKLTRQLEDTKTIDRAKCCLIQYLNLTESQAHRHIQKLAMDTRRTQREIADDILTTYSGMTNV